MKSIILLLFSIISLLNLEIFTMDQTVTSLPANPSTSTNTDSSLQIVPWEQFSSNLTSGQSAKLETKVIPNLPEYVEIIIEGTQLNKSNQLTLNDELKNLKVIKSVEIQEHLASKTRIDKTTLDLTQLSNLLFDLRKTEYQNEFKKKLSWFERHPFKLAGICSIIAITASPYILNKLNLFSFFACMSEAAQEIVK